MLNTFKTIQFYRALSQRRVTYFLFRTPIAIQAQQHYEEVLENL
jgi:hypothetical protein